MGEGGQSAIPAWHRQSRARYALDHSLRRAIVHPRGLGRCVSWHGAGRFARGDRRLCGRGDDAIIMRLADVQLTIPGILLAILINGIGARLAAA